MVKLGLALLAAGIAVIATGALSAKFRAGEGLTGLATGISDIFASPFRGIQAAAGALGEAASPITEFFAPPDEQRTTGRVEAGAPTVSEPNPFLDALRSFFGTGLIDLIPRAEAQPIGEGQPTAEALEEVLPSPATVPIAPEGADCFEVDVPLGQSESACPSTHPIIQAIGVTRFRCCRAVQETGFEIAGPGPAITVPEPLITSDRITRTGGRVSLVSGTPEAQEVVQASVQPLRDLIAAIGLEEFRAFEGITVLEAQEELSRLSGR